MKVFIQDFVSFIQLRDLPKFLPQNLVFVVAFVDTVVRRFNTDGHQGAIKGQLFLAGPALLLLNDISLEDDWLDPRFVVDGRRSSLIQMSVEVGRRRCVIAVADDSVVVVGVRF